jgi:hypothetical protein
MLRRLVRPRARVPRVAAALLAIAAARAASAQEGGRPGPRMLVRADAIAARASAVQLGVGAGLAAGNYVRVEATVAGGVTHRGGATVGGGRMDLVGRFLVDPFAQTPRGPYAGGGVSVRRDGGDRAHVYLLALFGVEGGRYHGAYPSLELGLGGGVRLGLVLRASPAGRR